MTVVTLQLEEQIENGLASKNAKCPTRKKWEVWGTSSTYRDGLTRGLWLYAVFFFVVALHFTQRALCAAEILALAAADMLRRVRLGLTFSPSTPAKAETAAFNPASCRSTLSRSLLSCASTEDRFAVRGL